VFNKQDCVLKLYFKEHREAKGFESRTEFAESINMPATSYNGIEKGRILSPTYDSLRIIKNGLGLDYIEELEYLPGEFESKPRENFEQKLAEEKAKMDIEFKDFVKEANIRIDRITATYEALLKGNAAKIDR
jgi:transcriptional regulator with XRE-family HTH domain